VSEPLCPCREPLQRGKWTSWTVEGLYQGLKLFAIEDLSLVQPSVNMRVFASGAIPLIHTPSIMSVDKDLVRHPLFRLLKSGRRYDAKRNQTFGRLAAGRRNWTWTEHWRHPTLNVPVGRDRFRREVFVPAFQLALSQRPDDVRRLKSFWDRGPHLITTEMRLAHDHLAWVEECVVGWQR